VDDPTERSPAAKLPSKQVSPELQRAWDLSCTGRVDAALALAQQIHEDAAARGDAAGRARAATHLGWYCFMQGYYEEGMLHVLSACDVFSGLGDRQSETFARGTYAWLLIEIGSAHEALDEAMRALELAEITGDDHTISFATNVVGVVFWMLGQFDRALDFVGRAVNLARQVNDPIDLARWLINLGEIEAEFWQQRTRGKNEAVHDAPTALDRAKAYGVEALQLSRQTGDAWILQLAIVNLADYHLRSGDHDEAAQLLAQINMVDGGGGSRSRLAHLFILGKVQLAVGEAKAAIYTLTAALTLADELRDVETGVPCCQVLSDAWSRAGDFAEGLRWHRIFHDRYVRKTAASALIRSRVAAIQYETRQLQVSMEAERSRADALEEVNRALTQEATLLMNASMEDPLTGLPNRRGLERALLLLDRDPAIGYAIAMIDIDHFKQVNDSLSHATGDEVLRQVATLLKVGTRERDRLFRYGGEEFVLVVEGGDTVTAARTCRRICQVMRNWDWSRIHPCLYVTLSIGIAHAPEAANPAAVMALADRRLYDAKKAGRDRIVMHGPTMTEPSLTPTSRLH
jgi:diguanylate cyclase (GGDEF)-like protein